MGRDPTSRSPRASRHHFNPRARVGRDAAEEVARLDLAISIHAPAWGATVEAGRCKLELTFQSTRPVWGRDGLCAFRIPSTRDFNPRAPHGGATYAPALLDAAGLISIHVPRVGRDRYHRFYNRGRQISIHAPAWGATCRVARDIMHFAISIHAPAWGATRTAEAATLAGTISIHAPAWGATMDAMRSRRLGVISIHAPAWGATGGIHAADVICRISIHAPAWGATK